VMLIQTPDNPVEWPALLTDIVTKNQASKYIHYFRASEIMFEAEEEVNWVLDGEFGGTHKKVSINTCKQAIEIAVDKLKR